MRTEEASRLRRGTIVKPKGADFITSSSLQDIKAAEDRQSFKIQLQGKRDQLRSVRRVVLQQKRAPQVAWRKNTDTEIILAEYNSLEAQRKECSKELNDSFIVNPEPSLGAQATSAASPAPSDYYDLDNAEDADEDEDCVFGAFVTSVRRRCQGPQPPGRPTSQPTNDFSLFLMSTDAGEPYKQQ
ncbi:hypothetical protein S40293_10094 [Stachybotrys chartarum IBT 40293]|nr:hypothetical protein S40293_10094 [Stachybotrys chartarum IBT 40293]